MQGALAQHAMEQAVLSVAKRLEDQLDNQLHKLENLNDDDLERIRQKRIDEMRRQQDQAREWAAKGHGTYSELQEEKQFFKEVKGEERVVAHFYRDNWPCKVMDKHLGILCNKHLETKFVKINAEKSPYLTEKLKVWMLPTLALIKNEKVVDYVVGFDDLGGKDDFTTEMLEERLAAADAVKLDGGLLAAMGSGAARQPERSVRSGIYQRADDDEDSDFDD
ncbi:MAG: thioredoxin-like protein [Monoraphidium minutum]|nr:MAG: thioredoxin-like protein [Monoraphidium minutum]